MEQTETLTFIIIVNIILLIFIVGTILFVIQFRKRKVAYETEKNMITEKHTQDLLSTQVEMQQQTMQYIGREIHDNVGQKLTLASLYTQQLAYENKAPIINDKIEHIGYIINESLQELRKLSKSLTDDSITENDIVVLIRDECNKVNALQKSTVVFKPLVPNADLPYQTKSILLRVVQEFLQNSIKHANCKTINVSLDINDDTLHLNLNDDGIGFIINGKPSDGIGLSNMEKRIKVLNGNFDLHSYPNSGTTLKVGIPHKKI